MKAENSGVVKGPLITQIDLKIDSQLQSSEVPKVFVCGWVGMGEGGLQRILKWGKC